MKTKLFFIVMLNFFCLLNLSFAQWVKQNSGVNVGLYDICFVDSLIGWVVGYGGTILHSTNGGRSWMQQSNEFTESLQAVFFVDTLIGWAAGNKGLLLNTTTGGEVWMPQESTTILHLHDVFFVNHTIGWAVGGMQTSDRGVLGIIIGTTDGGTTWNRLIDSTRGGYLGVFFLDQNEGWVVGGKKLLDNFEEDIILHTTDGGINWQEQFTPTIGPLFNIYFLNKNLGWATGHSPLAEGALRTYDGGLTWQTVKLQQGPLVTSDLLGGLAVVDSNNIWISGWDAIYHSIDGGENWIEESRETENLITNIFFLDTNKGWAVGQAGSIWIYQNEPVSIRKIEVKEYENFLEQNYPNPFNPITTITYTLKEKSKVILTVYDILGRELEVLVNTTQDAGEYKLPFNASQLASGVYLYRLRVNDKTFIKKMLLTK